MSYKATYESIKQHPVPQWFHDGKLGIFIHWGLYSVPGYAPPGADIDKQVAEKGWEAMFTNNPYAEWYLNTYRVGDTATRRYHQQKYGPHFCYDDFAPMFNQAVERWNPDEWAELFEKVGASYVVLTTKHHDGFVLWPSAHSSPRKPSFYGTRRDLVGELTEAVRRHNMRMGLYYSGGLDWSFNEQPVRTFTDVYRTIVQSPDFVKYSHSHWHELIDRYQPSVLWNDIGYPAGADVPELFAHYYNHVPDGVVNDRWRQLFPDLKSTEKEFEGPPPSEHADFTTPEYARHERIIEKKWEATRGIGHSFGYNQNEGPEDYLSVEELVRSFVDIVSKNGNLLLDIGPMADGTIPELQKDRLLGLGEWLTVNGDAIFGSHPWLTFAGKASKDISVRYTQKDDSLYAVLMATPHGKQVVFEKLLTGADSTVQLLGQTDPIAWSQHENQLVINVPDLKKSPAHTFKITPSPRLLD